MMGFVRYAAIPSSWQRAASGRWPREVSIMISARERRIVLDVCCQGKAVHFRHHGIEEYQWKRFPHVPACVRAASAAWLLSAVAGRIPPWLSTS